MEIHRFVFPGDQIKISREKKSTTYCKKYAYFLMFNLGALWLVAVGC
jgi:hypothetical protein